VALSSQFLLPKQESFIYGCFALKHHAVFLIHEHVMMPNARSGSQLSRPDIPEAF